MKARKRNLTQADKDAARRLRALWDRAVERRKIEGVPLTQDRMAERLASATGRGTQGLVSQYLNGLIALNYRALLAFAEELGFDPSDVRSDLPEQHFSRRAGEPASPGSAESANKGSPELAELQAVLALTAIALASTIQPAGKELLAALERMPKALRDRAFVGDMIERIREELPVQPSQRVRGSAGRKRQKLLGS